MSYRPAVRYPVLRSLFLRYVEDQDDAAYATNVLQSYTQATLERLTEHGCREVRRGAVLALGLVGDYTANPVMARSLLDVDRTVRILAESGIRSVWARAGDPRHQRELRAITRLVTGKRFQEAAIKADRLIERAADYAEAWNQRAIAHFAMQGYAEAIRDCRQVLDLNPYHFGAAAGMGQAYLELGNPVAALESFRRALRLNPDMEGVRVQVVRLARLVEGNK